MPGLSTFCAPTPYQPRLVLSLSRPPHHEYHTVQQQQLVQQQRSTPIGLDRGVQQQDMAKQQFTHVPYIIYTSANVSFVYRYGVYDTAVVYDTQKGTPPLIEHVRSFAAVI